MFHWLDSFQFEKIKLKRYCSKINNKQLYCYLYTIHKIVSSSYSNLQFKNLNENSYAINEQLPIDKKNLATHYYFKKHVNLQSVIHNQVKISMYFLSLKAATFASIKFTCCPKQHSTADQTECRDVQDKTTLIKNIATVIQTW